MGFTTHIIKKFKPLFIPVVLFVLVSAIAIIPNIIELSSKSNSITTILFDVNPSNESPEKESESTDDLKDMIVSPIANFSYISNRDQLLLIKKSFAMLCNGFDGIHSPPPESVIG